MHVGIANYSGFLSSRWQGKRSRHSWRLRSPQFYVSGKRPMLLFSVFSQLWISYVLVNRNLDEKWLLSNIDGMVQDRSNPSALALSYQWNVTNPKIPCCIRVSTTKSRTRFSQRTRMWHGHFGVGLIDCQAQRAPTLIGQRWSNISASTGYPRLNPL